MVFLTYKQRAVRKAHRPLFYVFLSMKSSVLLVRIPRELQCQSFAVAIAMTHSSAVQTKIYSAKNIKLIKAGHTSISEFK